MAFLHMLPQVFFSAMGLFLLFVLWRVVFSCWISPNRVYRRIRMNGLEGPPPSFPLGNIDEMKKDKRSSSSGYSGISHDIHSTVFPYFSRWTKSYGKPAFFFSLFFWFFLDCLMCSVVTYSGILCCREGVYILAGNRAIFVRCRP